jgi:hypothetical protein
MSDMQDKHAMKETIQKLKERVANLEEGLEVVTKILDEITKSKEIPSLESLTEKPTPPKKASR